MRTGRDWPVMSGTRKRACHLRETGLEELDRVGTATASSGRRCGVALRVHDNVSMNDSPENTAARTLERVTGPFHFVVLAGVLNDRMSLQNRHAPQQGSPSS